ncbi:hypothetical protein F2P81_014252 [Scophthalmus maximus]|uniref:Uncharacterized protein n=1 Tax=Scophthalmus maximus TaxID=52904 RepID=A0A6A4SGA1_SCOMX|nr:hypothetical protein F2P81_014252 [Scophthalmus maximus]
MPRAVADVCRYQKDILFAPSERSLPNWRVIFNNANGCRLNLSELTPFKKKHLVGREHVDRPLGRETTDCLIGQNIQGPDVLTFFSLLPKCLSVTLTRCLRRSSIQPEAKATGIDEAKKKRKVTAGNVQ